jgi:hypothetical protein
MYGWFQGQGSDPLGSGNHSGSCGPAYKPPSARKGKQLFLANVFFTGTFPTVGLPLTSPSSQWVPRSSGDKCQSGVQSLLSLLTDCKTLSRWLGLSRSDCQSCTMVTVAVPPWRAFYDNYVSQYSQVLRAVSGTIVSLIIGICKIKLLPKVKGTQTYSIFGRWAPQLTLFLKIPTPPR